MVNPELIKLLTIIGGGIIVGGVGQVIIIKNKKRKLKEREEMMSNYGSYSSSFSSNEISPQEQVARKYIEDYKSSYSKESIKAALINSGNSEEDVNLWIEKYF